MSKHVGMGKHYCEYCRCWVQPDPQSIKLHSQGLRHKQAERDFLFQQRKAKEDDKHSQRELAKALQEIEAAAAEAIARDLAPRHSAPVSSSVPYRPQTGQSHAGEGAGARDMHGRQTLPPPPPPLPAGESSSTLDDDAGDGLYEVRGMAYLMGEHEEARGLMGTGRSVEARVADKEGEEGSWKPALLRGVREIAVPHTKVVLRHCFISLLTPLPSGIQDMEVIPAAIRLPVTTKEADEIRKAYEGKRKKSREEASAAGAPPLPPPTSAAPRVDEPTYEIDPNTGLGKWTSHEPQEDDAGESSDGGEDGVASSRQSKRRRVDRPHTDTDDLASLHANPSMALDLLSALRAREGRDGAGVAEVRTGYDDGAEGSEGAMDVLAAYNPHGGGKYKGIALPLAQGGEGDGEGLKLPHGASDRSILPGIVALQSDSAQSSSTSATGASSLPAHAQTALLFAVRKAPANLKLRKRDDD